MVTGHRCLFFSDGTYTRHAKNVTGQQTLFDALLSRKTATPVIIIALTLINLISYLHLCSASLSTFVSGAIQISIVIVWLHFLWGIAEARNIYWSRPSVCLWVSVCVSVCLSVPHGFPTLLHRPRCNLGMVGVPSSCAPSGGFAIGARASLLWQHTSMKAYSHCKCV